MKIHEHEKEIISRMIYHQGYAVRMEQVLTDPDHPQGILVPVFDLDRIEDIRSAIARGYLDFAASYGDLFRLTSLDIIPDGNAVPPPRYSRTRTHWVEQNGYAVKMEIEFSQPGSPWGAGIPLPDSERSQAAHQALKRGDLETAAQYGKVYRLEPVDVEPVVKPWRPSEKEAEWKAKREAETQSAG